MSNEMRKPTGKETDYSTMRDVSLWGIRPGTIMLTQIGGIVGKIVWLLQAINGDLSRWTHVAVVLDDLTVFEAQPGGAVISPLSDYGHANVAFVPWEMDDETREAIVATAKSLAGTGYSWDTYIMLAAYRLGLPFLSRLFRKRVQDSRFFICSQAADHIYRLNGQYLFTDGRMPYDVTPGDFRFLLKGRH